MSELTVIGLVLVLFENPKLAYKVYCFTEVMASIGINCYFIYLSTEGVIKSYEELSKGLNENP